MKEIIMNKVWIVEEIRDDYSTQVMGVHSGLASARKEVLKCEALEDNKCNYLITGMTVQR